MFHFGFLSYTFVLRTPWKEMEKKEMTDFVWGRWGLHQYRKAKANSLP